MLDHKNKDQSTQRQLRVLLVGPSLKDVGGVANYLNILQKNIDRNQVALFYVPVGRSSPQSLLWCRPIDYLNSVYRFLKSLFRNHYDLIQLNPSFTKRSLPLNMLLLIIAKVFSQVPVIIFFHGWDNQMGCILAENRMISVLLKQILKRADFYMVLSRSFREVFIKAGFASDRIKVFSLMVDISAFNDSGEDFMPNNDQNRPFKVLFLSRIERDKGVRTLSEAIRWIHQNHPEVPIEFNIAGSGLEEEFIKTSLRQEISDGLVKMPGYLIGIEKVKAYQTADLYVFPSFHEGFPTTILEAMAAGLPLIYTPVGALKEVLGPENGICIQLDNLSGVSLGIAILTLCQDVDRRMAMSQVNQKLVKERYDIKSACSNVVDIYKELLGVGLI